MTTHQRGRLSDHRDTSQALALALLTRMIDLPVIHLDDSAHRRGDSFVLPMP